MLLAPLHVFLECTRFVPAWQRSRRPPLRLVQCPAAQTCPQHVQLMVPFNPGKDRHLNLEEMSADESWAEWEQRFVSTLMGRGRDHERDTSLFKSTAIPSAWNSI